MATSPSEQLHHPENVATPAALPALRPRALPRSATLALAVATPARGARPRHSRPVDVYGNSGGASFALGAATLTTNLRRLVLYEPALDPGALLPDGLLERVDELLAAGAPDAVVETFFCEVLHMDDEAVATYRAQPSWAARVATAHTLPRELRIPPERMFDRHRAAQVSVPVLLFQGSTTPAGLKSALTELAATLPEARVVDLDGQGHTADVLAPELLAAELAAFLR